MARIRTIKPEFCHSESMGRISLEARLTFILLWTICDDSGRTRGDSRMLARLLFPYDEDITRARIESWLVELEQEGCIERYQAVRTGADGHVDATANHYLQVCNWLQHQKIDKPTPSRLPSQIDKIRESSRATREHSSGDLDLDLDLDQDQDQGSLLGVPSLDKVQLKETIASILESWNQAPGVRHVRKPDELSKARRAHLVTRLKDPDWPWREALAKFPLPCFSESNGWKPDFDWFLKPDTCDKILEGKYDWSKEPQKQEEADAAVEREKTYIQQVRVGGRSLHTFRGLLYDNGDCYENPIGTFDWRTKKGTLYEETKNV